MQLGILKRPAILAVSLTSLSAIAVTTGALLFSSKGESSFKITQDEEGRVAYTNTTQHFEMVQTWNGQTPPTLLNIKQSVTTWEGVDGISGSVYAQAFVDGREKFDQKVWSIQDEANDFRVTYEPSFFVTIAAGCCGNEDTYRAYNLKTGKPVLSYTTPASETTWAQAKPFSINIPNSQQLDRVIGVLSYSAVRDFPVAGTGAGINANDGYQRVAVITYATTEAALQQVAVLAKIPDGWAATIGDVELVNSLSSSTKNELQAGRLTLWDSDGRNEPQAFSGFAVRLKIYLDTTYEAVLPVNNDRLDVDEASAMGLVRFERLK